MNPTKFTVFETNRFRYWDEPKMRSTRTSDQPSGILKSMATRLEFLSDLRHRIRFVYLPKHSSWLNQIEIEQNQRCQDPFMGTFMGKYVKQRVSR